MQHSLGHRTPARCRLDLKKIIVVAVMLIPVVGMARICISTGNGNWNNAATWSCPGTPLPGDTVIIQAGHIVYQTNNQNYSGAPLQIHVYGTWQFSGGGSKISLPCGSTVEIQEGGSLLPDPAFQAFSETLRICNITYWNTTMGGQEGPVIWPPPPSPLPVELITFEAANNTIDIQLRWSTASEWNTSHFMIHRSSDLQERVIVGSHPAAGSSMTLREYFMKDVPRSSGQYYYHLDEVGLDGTQVELAIATARFQQRDRTLRCMPNPLNTTDALMVELPAHENGLEVHLVGTEGRWTRPSSVDMDGTLIVIMDGLHLSSGIYMLRVMEGGELLGTCRFRLE
jgi:hypothetical protein